METFKEIFKYIYYKIFNDETDLKKEARLFEEEVTETARRYAASIGWTNNFHQNLPHIQYKQEKLVWDVFSRQRKTDCL